MLVKISVNILPIKSIPAAYPESARKPESPESNKLLQQQEFHHPEGMSCKQTSESKSILEHLNASRSSVAAFADSAETHPFNPIASSRPPSPHRSAPSSNNQTGSLRRSPRLIGGGSLMCDNGLSKPLLGALPSCTAAQTTAHSSLLALCQAVCSF